MLNPPPALAIPPCLASILTDMDAVAGDIEEGPEGMSLRLKFTGASDLPQNERKAFRAEVAALLFRLEKDGKSPWGTRYGPDESFVRQDGTRHCFPDLTQVDEDIISYWIRRVADARHPVLKARYADLVWDLSKTATSKKPPVEMAQQAVDSYMECAKRYPHSYQAQARLERAFELAMSIRDKPRSSSVLSAMFDLATQPGNTFHAVWLLALELSRKEVVFSPEQVNRLVEIVETRLKAVCESELPFGPAVLEEAEPLARHYDRIGSHDEKKRVICIYGQTIKKVSEKIAAIAAAQWLHEAYGVFVTFGLKEEAEFLQLAARAKSEEAARQMVTHRVSFAIPTATIDAFRDDITAGDLESTFKRIAVNFCPRLADVRKQMMESREKHKIFSYVSFATVSGIETVHTIGSPEDDPDGCLMFQLRDNMQTDGIALQIALDGTRTRP